MPDSANEPAEVVIKAAYKNGRMALKLDGDGDGGEMAFIFDRSQVAPAAQAWALFAGEFFEIVIRPEGAGR